MFACIVTTGKMDPSISCIYAKSITKKRTTHEKTLNTIPFFKVARKVSRMEIPITIKNRIFVGKKL